MANQQQMIRLMQNFVRRYVSSGAAVTEVFYRQLSATWVGYVRLDAGLEAKLIAVRQGDEWDIKIRDMMLLPLLPPVRNGMNKPPEPMKLKSIRLKLDRSYADGLISYEEYCRRLRLIGQR
ncbi:MAG TPA: hypothetical protein V6D05_06395 [Stenomitos sp.]